MSSGPRKWPIPFASVRRTRRGGVRVERRRHDDGLEYRGLDRERNDHLTRLSLREVHRESHRLQPSARTSSVRSQSAARAA